MAEDIHLYRSLDIITVMKLRKRSSGALRRAINACYYHFSNTES